MKILVLTFGNGAAASTLYRVNQYLTPLAQLGFEIHARPSDGFDDWKSLADYDAVVVQKKLFSGRRVRLLRKYARRLMYETDDAIWQPHDRPHHWFTRWRTDRRLALIAGLADRCTAANELLATRLRQYSRCVDVIPMALDETVWNPLPRESGARLRIGWAGAPVNLRYLYGIESSLFAAQQKHPEVEIVVYCGESPKFTSGLRSTHIPFRPGAEALSVQTFDIGLLPLPDNPFAHGKSPIKGLQYMACGTATIASPFGATQEMFTSGETAIFATSENQWTSALLMLIEDASLRSRIANQASATFRTRHARSQVMRKLAETLKNLGSDSGCV